MYLLITTYNLYCYSLIYILLYMDYLSNYLSSLYMGDQGNAQLCVGEEPCRTDEGEVVIPAHLHVPPEGKKPRLGAGGRDLLLP